MHDSDKQKVRYAALANFRNRNIPEYRAYLLNWPKLLQKRRKSRIHSPGERQAVATLMLLRVLLRLTFVPMWQCHIALQASQR